MSGRKADPKSIYKMCAHTANHYQYAATVSTVYKDGKRIRKYTHWGSLSRELVFTPNIRFATSPKKIRDQFVFPDGWDISAALKLNAEVPSVNGLMPEVTAGTSVTDEEYSGYSRTPVGHDSPDVSVFASDGIISPAATGRYRDLLYGSVWFLLQIAEIKHVIEDLMVAFDYNRTVVNDILTLAIFPYLTCKNFDRLAREQRITHYPSEHALTPSYITQFTQAITAQNRMDFFKLRIGRQPEGAYLACDSTTRSAWGRCIAEIHYGRNKDNRDMNCTLEVVVYSLTTHEPVYYRMFPGNEPDAGTVRTIISDIRHLGVEELITIYDRGYESADNFDEFFRDGLPFISCAKVAQEPVIDCLLLIEYDAQGLPQNMEYNSEERLFYAQFKIENRTYTDPEGNTRTVEAGDLKCNVFMDPTKRPLELIDLNEKILNERSSLEEKRRKGELLEQRETINRALRFHKVRFKYYPETGCTEVFIEENEPTIRKARAACGFFSSVSYKVDGNAMIMLRAYKTRDEQEKYFEQMKDQMDFHTQDCSSQDGKAGREFILFVGLILSSAVRNTWRQSLELRKRFNTSLSLLDEMADIRWIQYEDGEEHITSFLEAQVEICKSFGIVVPPECLSTADRKAVDRKANPQKRGRKPKGTTAPNKLNVVQC